ncbi:MAG: TonB family protein [Betaproteobacteria bacterium]|nr:TonB family protein [Betaproteobacteria bacterium]
MQANEMPVVHGRSSAPRLLEICALSLALHVAVFALFAVPEPPQREAGPPLDVFLIPLTPGASELRTPPEKGETKLQPDTVQLSAAAELKPVAKGGSPDASEAVVNPPQPASEPAPRESSRPRQPFVSVAPGVPPVADPTAGSADAAGYPGPLALDKPAELPEAVQVAYPQEAFPQGRAGMVFVEAWIDADGSVVQARSLPGSDDTFSAAALTGLRNTRLKPAEQKGRPVKSRAYFVVHFVLE